MWFRKQLPAFLTSSAGKVNSCLVPDGVKVHAIFLEVGDNDGIEVQTGNLIDDIVVKVFGNPERTMSAVQLAQLNALRGSRFGLQTSGAPGTAAFRTYIPIWFSTPWVEPRSAGNALGWNLEPGAKLMLDVEVVAGVNTPVLGGWYYYTPLDGALALIEKWARTSVQVSGTANEHAQFDKRDLIQSMHFFPSSAGKYVSQMKVTRNGQILVEDITHLQNQAELMGLGLQPDTVAVPRFDLMYDGEDPQDLGLLANGLNEFTVKTSYNAANSGTMDVMTIRIGKPIGRP